MGLKPEHEQIRNVLSHLAGQDWVKRTERRWWPQFVLHYTDIRNAAQILQDNCLYSRKHLENEGRLVISSGSPSVLAGTNIAIKDCVRLYFRPKTPTQYHAEGIYSQAALSRSKYPEAHCPVPVFFLFDSTAILSRADCQFSDGGLNRPEARILSTAVDLEQLPWKKIYHTGGFNPHQAEQSDIAFRRNAEVIVSRRLDLSALRYIYCRSDAERETLLYLLPPDLQSRYRNKMVATARGDLFYRRQTFVETVRLSSKAAHFQFSPETQSPGPYQMRVELEVASRRRSGGVEDFQLERPYVLEMPLPSLSVGYTIRLYLDNHLAYASTFEEIEIPF